MDGGGQQLLSGAALAGDEDGVIRGGQAPGRAHHLLHGAVRHTEVFKMVLRHMSLMLLVEEPAHVGIVGLGTVYIPEAYDPGGDTGELHGRKGHIALALSDVHNSLPILRRVQDVLLQIAVLDKPLEGIPGRRLPVELKELHGQSVERHDPVFLVHRHDGLIQIVDHGLQRVFQVLGLQVFFAEMLEGLRQYVPLDIDIVVQIILGHVQRLSDGRACLDGDAPESDVDPVGDVLGSIVEHTGRNGGVQPGNILGAALVIGDIPDVADAHILQRPDRLLRVELGLVDDQDLLARR